MIPDRASAILEMVAASFARARGMKGVPILAGDKLSELDLSHLRLLGVLIALEDKFAVEFPPDAIASFRNVGDVASYIESHEMTRDDDATDEQPTSADRLGGVWTRAGAEQPGWRLGQWEGWFVRELSRLFRDGFAALIGVWAFSRQR